MKRTDCRLGAEKLCLVVFFFSLLEVMTGRGELTECSKLTCFAKRMLDMVPGDSAPRSFNVYGLWAAWPLLKSRIPGKTDMVRVRSK